MVAAAICAVAFALGLIFHEPLSETGFLTFFPVLFLAAWWGGRGPGLLATALGTLAGIYLFQEPFSVMLTSYEPLLETTLFALTGVLIALLSGQLHAARQDAEEREALATGLQTELGAILSTVADGIAATNADGRILYANDATARLFGLAGSPELIGLSLRDLFERVTVENEAGQHQSWSKLPFEAALANGVAAQSLVLLKGQDDSDRWVVFSVQPVVKGAGQAEMMIVVMADISSIKRAEQEHDTWMQALAHDLKSPLAAVRMSVQLGLRRLKHGNNTAAAEALTMGVASSDRLANMIDQLTDLARLRIHGALDLNLAPCDVVALAREAVRGAATTSPLHQVQLDCALAEIRIVADAERLRRVFENLLGNAIKYSPSGGPVEVKVYPEGDQVVVSISDTGIGIASEDLGRVFERFRRGGNVGAVEGSGLGLSFCQSAIAAHGGQLAIDSTVGLGTTVTVRLPVAPPEAVESAPLAAADGHPVSASHEQESTPTKRSWGE